MATKKYKRTQNGKLCDLCAFLWLFPPFPPKVMVAEAALCYDAGFVFEEDFE